LSIITQARTAEKKLDYFFLMEGKGSFVPASGSPHEVYPAFNCLPKLPQVTPSLFSQGLWDAQVPRNSPFLIKSSRTESSKKKSAKIPMLNKKTVI
jgi:hypothetical protein